MKGRQFAITLAAPSPPDGPSHYRVELDSVCDRFVCWRELDRTPLFSLLRFRHLFGAEPVPVTTDRDPVAAATVAQLLDEEPDIAVFDFVHSVVLAPEHFRVPTVMFTHNVEAEIFRRHANNAKSPLKRLIWRDQYRKMYDFERRHLARFDAVVAVSERDAAHFRDEMGIGAVRTIPTGVDLDFLDYSPPTDVDRVVITASMDWFANIDGVEFFMDEVWPRIIARRPSATMIVVGRKPPDRLRKKVKQRRLAWMFTGFVDDVRPYIRESAVFVIPLRVGGGTRLKAFEAMALGCPVVSTTIGVEGLSLEAGTHFLRADTPADFADAVVRLLADRPLRHQVSQAARKLVETKFDSDIAALAFEGVCASVLDANSVAVSA
jgi:glycosyltransferase involved in cell wall biosynthesis